MKNESKLAIMDHISKRLTDKLENIEQKLSYLSDRSKDQPQNIKEVFVDILRENAHDLRYCMELFYAYEGIAKELRLKDE